MGKFTISMAIFHSKLLVYQQVGFSCAEHVFDGHEELRQGDRTHNEAVAPRVAASWIRDETGSWFGTCFIFPYIENNHPN